MKLLFTPRISISLRIALLTAFAAFAGLTCASTFLDPEPVYWDFFGQAVIVCGVLYLTASLLFLKGKTRWFWSFMIAGFITLIAGCIIYWLFYGFAAAHAEWKYVG
ncbi:hypothetical protein [Chitinophaga agri]|uniref:Integron gene cassette protein n=1 Tax=Chitinophaga agri TaxID=2703787 RepID=A0A6B9ZEP2_9BACT|nr:hypothetical protein [Chitinophaga agri]QHS59615.1 hypothetical protein GWR21_08435 [Chitinophaga agri]